MRIIIDIGHPAHVHYFRNFIKLMQAKGHEFFISARDRSIIHYLLNFYQIPYYNRGKGKNGIIGKVFYMIVADIRLLKRAIQFKPDLFISFASPYAAQVSWFLYKPHIVLDDTEHARFGHMFYKPFSNTFLNPQSFKKDFGQGQIRFNSFTEMFYLHETLYKADDSVFDLLKLNKGEKFVLLRFVSWKANHDIGHFGLNLETKKALVKILLEKGFKVFISSELDHHDPMIDKFLLKVPPERIHDVLRFSELLICESGTMASESAILGTPVIYVNSLPLMGYLEEEQKAGMLFHFSSSEGVIDKVKELLSLESLRTIFQENQQRMLKGKINATAFLVWFIENYPESNSIMKSDSKYQFNFLH